MTAWKKIFFSSIFFGFIAVAGETNAFLNTLSPAERTYLKQHNVVRVHNEMNWPPFNFNVNGQAKGFSIDLMNTLAKRIGLKVQYVSGYSWGEFLSMLQNDTLDIMINVSITPERQKNMVFTQPFLHAKNAIYTNVKKEAIYTLRELEGKHVALVKDFFIQKYLAKHYPAIKQVLVPDLPKALEMLSFEKVDAVVGKQVVVDYILRENLISSIMATDYLVDPGTISHLAFAGSKNESTLIRIFDKALASLDPNVLEELKHQWFGINALLNTKELLTKEERVYLQQKKNLRICCQTNNTPVEYKGKTGPSGISVDIMQAIAHRLKIDLAYVPVDSREESLDKLQKNICDLASGFFQVTHDAKSILYSRPYLTYRLGIVAQKSNPVANIDQAINKTYATWGGDPMRRSLQKKYPNLHWKKKTNIQDVLKSIQQGESDFALVPKEIYDYLEERGKCDDLIFADISSRQSNVALAVSRNNPGLLTILDKVLKITPIEAFHAISDKWMNSTVIKKIDYTMIWKILAAVLLVLVVVLLAYRRQRRLARDIERLNTTLEERIKAALERNQEQQIVMFRQDRLARMGEMIAMIAHQWRQPLNNLALVNQLLASRYKNDKLDTKAMAYFQEKSQKLIVHMSETIDDFRNFYNADRKKTDYCVEDSVGELLSRIRMIYEDAGVTIDFTAKGCSQMHGFPNELNHVIQNILANAKDALLELDRKPRSISVVIREEKETILIRISDNAAGIPEEILEKIFDPYFSTKGEKNGTGLGLYMANLILTELMKSKITVKSTPKGTTFLIHLQKSIK